MTVAQLMLELSKLPSTAIVVRSDSEWDGFIINSVTYHDKVYQRTKFPDHIDLEDAIRVMPLSVEERANFYGKGKSIDNSNKYSKLYNVVEIS